MKVSICIPTYNRLEKLKICLESCLNQTIKPYEILIGDDSTVNDTENYIKSLNNPIIKYMRNKPSLGQFKNVDKIIQSVVGEYLILIHDDDLLELNSTETLIKCIKDNHNKDISAVYGKQKLILDDGTILNSESEKLNFDYYRTKQFEGIQDNKLLMSLRSQFPNNGYLIKANEAKKVSYIKAGEAEDACDFYFGVLFAENASGDFYFINKYTTQYRLSEVAVSKYKYNNASYNAFKILLNFENIVKETVEIKKLLKETSSKAIYQAANLNYRLTALKWYFSKYHRNKILSLGGVKRLLLIFRPYP